MAIWGWMLSPCVQRAVHDVVNTAVEAGIANAVEGSSFALASRAASDAILSGLLAIGILQVIHAHSAIA